jgi:hypothetical protein
MGASGILVASPTRTRERTRPWWLRVFSFPVFLGAMLVFGAFVCVRSSAYDPDTWWHVTVGNQILTTHTWPTRDHYSYTASGTRWIAYEWLGEVVIAAASRAGGVVGQKVLLVCLAGLFIVLLYAYATLVSGGCKAAFAACATVLAPAALFFTLRPQLIGYIFLLVLLICLELFRRGKSRAIWLLPPLFLIWVNTHGSFAFGLFVLAVWWLSGLVGFHFGGIQAKCWTQGQRLQLELAAFLSLLATLCTPYGTRLFSYPLQMALFQPLNIANISEWQSLNPSLAIGKWFLAFLLILFLSEILLRPAHRLEFVSLLLVTIVVASLHRRFLVVFLMIFTPWLATLLSRWASPYRAEVDKPVFNGILMIAGIAALVAFFPSREAIWSGIAKNYPVGAVRYLNTHAVPGPMLNEYGWGGYLIYTRAPKNKVFIDGRADIYEYSGALADYQEMALLKPDALSVLRKNGIRACLLRRQAPLRSFLAGIPDWKIVYQDKLSTLLVKQAGTSGPGASARESAVLRPGLLRPAAGEHN